MNNFALVFLVLEAFLIAGFIAFSFTNYKERFHLPYDLRNHFPYELNYESKFKDNFLGNLLLALAIGCGIAFYITFDSAKQNGYFLFVMVGGIIHLLSIFFLAFVPLKLTKSHLALVTLEIVLSFLIPFAIAINASLTYNTSKDNSYLTFIILPTILCIAIFILIMNPKLTKWSKMDEKKNEDGTTTYLRPRYFILAFYEWILLFFSLIIQLVVILSTLVLK